MKSIIIATAVAAALVGCGTVQGTATANPNERFIYAIKSMDGGYSGVEPDVILDLGRKYCDAVMMAHGDEADEILVENVGPTDGRIMAEAALRTLCPHTTHVWSAGGGWKTP